MIGWSGGGYVLICSGRVELDRDSVRLGGWGVGSWCPMIWTGEKGGASGENVGVVVIVVGGGVVVVVVSRDGGEAFQVWL